MRKLNLVKMHFLVIFTILCFGFMAPAAEASPMHYIFTGTAWGDVDGVEFNNANFSIDILGDTTNVVIDSFGPLLENVTGTMTLFGGVENISYSGSFNDLLYVFVDSLNEGVGFGAPPPLNLAVDELILYATGVGLDIYDLTSQFGPIQGLDITGIINFFSAGMSFGVLTLDQVLDPTFQAAVPLPGTMMLLGSGLAALLGLKRRFIG